MVRSTVFSVKIVIFITKSSICLLYLLAYCLIFFGYYKFIVPQYGYAGFVWHPNYIKIIEGVFFITIIPWLLPCMFKKPSDILLHLQFLFPIVPMIVLHGAAGYPGEFLYYSLTAYFMMILIASYLRLKPIRIVRLSPVVFQRVLLILAWGIICAIVLFGGWKYLNFDFTKVYEYRLLSASHLPKIFGYLSPLTTKVILPFALLLAVKDRNWLFAIAALGGSFLMFGLTAHKAHIFYPFAVLSLYYLLNRKNPIIVLGIGYVAIVFVSLLDFAMDIGMIGSLILRRVFMVPANLNYMYYDFFSHNPFVLWAQSKLSFGILDYGYNLDPSHLIGSMYFGSDLTGANTGWIGSGYMNAGFLGMLIYATIIGVFLAILNAHGKLISKSIVVSMITAPIMAVMMSSDLPSAFLTHGGILSLLFFMILADKQNSPH